MGDGNSVVALSQVDGGGLGLPGQPFVPDIAIPLEDSILVLIQPEGCPVVDIVCPEVVIPIALGTEIAKP